MKKVGLVGEAPNDTQAFKALFSEAFKAEAEFIELLDDIHGSQLDNQKTKRFLRIEYEDKKPDLVVFMRDLDGLETNKHQLDVRKNYFAEFKTVVDRTALYFLNIYELEALVLADIEIFNREYKTEIGPVADPMLIEMPKEYLIERTKQPNKYNESQNPELFRKLRIKQLLNCRYFAKFYKELSNALGKAS
ncbi:MAG: DUF4276 family protein [Bacteroidia bacterium]